jgi:hypothetical protein
MNIWHFQTALTRRLLAWSIFSIISGALLTVFRDGLLRGIGAQFIGWGFIDALIALGGRQAAQKRLAALPDPTDPAITAAETANLRRLLALNTGLDVLYILGGVWLERTKGQSNRLARGSGLGILIQGAFLFVFDLLHTLRLTR